MALLKAALGPNAPRAAPFASFPESLIAAGWLPPSLLRTDPERAIAIARRRLAPLASPAASMFTFNDTPSGTVVRVVGRIAAANRQFDAAQALRANLAARSARAFVAGADFDLVDVHGRRLRIMLAHCRLAELTLDEALAFQVDEQVGVEAIGALDRRVDPDGVANGRDPPLLLLLGPTGDAQVLVARASSRAGTDPMVTVP